MPDHQILTPEAHADLRVLTDRSPERGDAVMSCITLPDEFRRVQNDYPILFQRDPATGDFGAVALFGFETGENLFLSDGRWDARYRPLAMEIQPFLIGRAADGSDTRQVHVDMASLRLGDEGTRVFDEDGRTTPYMDAVIDRLRALDKGFVASADFFAALNAHDLLEPLTMDVTLDDGSKNRLVGFHIIDEEALQDLDPAATAELHAAGHLMPIFMALASLGNIGELVARKNRAVRG